MRRKTRQYVVAAAAVLVALLLAFLILPFVTVGAPKDLAYDGIGVEKVEVAGDPSPYSAMLLAIDVTSAVDIQSLAMANGLAVRETVSPCHDGKVNARQRLFSDVGNYLYDDFGTVDGATRPGVTRRTAPGGKRDKAGRIHYYLYVAPVQETTVTQDQYRYNLIRRPTDLCVEITGLGNYGLGSEFPMLAIFRSNVVVVPKAAVADAASHVP